MAAPPRPARVRISTREALLHAMVPAPGDGLPALAQVDLRDFWRRFDAAAPLHLRLGLAAAAVLLGQVLPLLSRGRSLAALSAADQDRVLQRAATLPGLDQLVLVVKVVACLAYFDDPAVDDRVRGLATGEHRP